MKLTGSLLEEAKAINKSSALWHGCFVPSSPQTVGIVLEIGPQDVRFWCTVLNDGCTNEPITFELCFLSESNCALAKQHLMCNRTNEFSGTTGPRNFECAGEFLQRTIPAFLITSYVPESTSVIDLHN